MLKLFLPLSLLAPVTSRLADSLVGLFGAGSVSSQVEWVSATIWLYPVTQQATVETSAPLAGSLYLALLLAWFTALGWILVRRLRRSRRERNVPWSASSIRREPLEAKLRDAIAPTRIPQEALLLVQGSGMPAVRGLLRPRIELPAQVVELLTVSDLTAVLLHEEEHRRRRDPLRQWPVALASWFFFFYPPLRWLLRRVYETTEMACDEAVLRHGIASRDYVRSIARTLELGLGPADVRPAFIGPGRSSLRRRLARLNLDRRYRTMLAHRIVLAIAASVVLLGSVVPLTPGTQAADETAVATASPARFAALDRLASAGTEVNLEFNEVAVDEILDIVSRVATFKLELDPTVSGEPISIKLEAGTVREALIELAEIAGLYYEVPDPMTLRVGHYLLPGQDGVSSPRRINDSAGRPVYPEELRKNRVQGRVILQAVIDRSGDVRDVKVLSSDHPSFSRSAIAAVEQWRYEPATLDGSPVGVYFTAVIEFDLGQGKTRDKQHAPLLKVLPPVSMPVGQALDPGKDGVSSPRRIEESAVKPVYPEEMRQAKVEGRVILQCVIDRSGGVREIEVLRTDHESFSEFAIAALKQWRYEPAMLEEKPVEFLFTVVIEFDMKGGKPLKDEGGETL